MQTERTTIAGWANYPTLPNATIFKPENREEVIQVIQQNDALTLRGNGKAYGDAALGKTVLSSLGLNKIRHFDQENGIVDCDAGVLLADLLSMITAAGWFFAVTPGIRWISIGGAIASDVHGKNHPTEGCFSHHLIDFELALADGNIVTCSQEQNAALFWQTCGGMGWTGMILSARIQLRRIASTRMQQRTVRLAKATMQDFVQTFEENRSTSYAAAWVDFSRPTLRGAVHFAEHDPRPHLDKISNDVSWKVPFFAPNGLLNSLSIKAYNEYYFRKNPTASQVVGFDQYFYPLDAIANWNRLYGARGFIQYHFCIPQQNAVLALDATAALIKKHGETPFLTVLKRHGAPHPKAVNSFPFEGYSLALDFPRTRGMAALIAELDALLWPLGGKVYLSKDAISDPRMARINPADFGHSKFTSLQRQRLVVP